MRARIRPRSTLLCALAVGALSACSDASTNPNDAIPTTTDAAATPNTSTSLVIVGEPVNPYTLSVGVCFNRYDAGTTSITTKALCEEPHQREVFFAASHPAPFGEPWPGEDALQRYGLRLCYQQFEDFVGIIYELSELGIGVLTPPQANWQDSSARYRGITCYVTRNDGKLLVGSMRGKAL